MPCLTRRSLQSSSETNVYACEITQQSQKEMVFWDTLFFLIPVEMKRPSMPGRYCSVWDRYFLKALLRQSKSSSLVTSTKSSKDRIVNSSNAGQAQKDSGGQQSQEGRRRRRTSNPKNDEHERRDHATH